MTKKLACQDCEYCVIDYYYDNENYEEYEAISCKQEHHEHVEWDAEPCEDFKED